MFPERSLTTTKPPNSRNLSLRLATIVAAVQGELHRVSQTLTGRIRQLAERYATPRPKIIDEVATLADRVNGHLIKMGFNSLDFDRIGASLRP